MALRRVQRHEQERLAAIERGEHIPPWVDRLPKERGAETIDAAYPTLLP